MLKAKLTSIPIVSTASELLLIHDAPEVIFAPTMAGLPYDAASALAILPIHDVNEGVIRSLPDIRASKTKVCVAIFAVDPFHDWSSILDGVAEAGSKAVINWPSVGILNEKIERELASVEFGYQREIEFVQHCSAAGWHVTATVFEAEQAFRMVDAGCHRLLFHPPLKETDGKMDFATAQDSLTRIKLGLERSVEIYLYAEGDPFFVPQDMLRQVDGIAYFGTCATAVRPST